MTNFSWGGEYPDDPAAYLNNYNVEHRRMRSAELSLGATTLECVGIESDTVYMAHEELVPADWRLRLSDAISRAKLVMTPYFGPELEQTVFNHPWVGEEAKEDYEEYYSVYGFLDGELQRQQKRVVVADIANQPRYAILEARGTQQWMIANAAGPHDPQITRAEQYYPTSVDARRQYTARALAQIARNSSDSQRILYVAAPAHISRVIRYLTQPPTRTDRLREGFYDEWLTGRLGPFDREIRTYSFLNDAWRRLKRERITTNLRKAANFRRVG